MERKHISEIEVGTFFRVTGDEETPLLLLKDPNGSFIGVDLVKSICIALANKCEVIPHEDSSFVMLPKLSVPKERIGLEYNREDYQSVGITWESNRLHKTIENRVRL